VRRCRVHGFYRFEPTSPTQHGMGKLLNCRARYSD